MFKKSPNRLALISAKLDERLDRIIAREVLAELAKVDVPEVVSDSADSIISALEGRYSVDEVVAEAVETAVGDQDPEEAVAEAARQAIAEEDADEALAQAAKESVEAAQAAKAKADADLAAAQA